MSTALPQAVRSHLDDPDRLAAVARLGLLGTPREEAFDRLTRLAARVLSVRGALVTVTTAEVQFCKSSVGLPEPWASSGLPLTYGLCPYTVASGEPLLVADARTDPRFHDNPGVRELGLAGYAGVPLLTSDGQAIGAFCAFDDRPRTWTAEDLQTLEDLAAATMTEVELRATTAAMRARAATLREEGATLEIINHVGRLLTAELDLATLVQAVTDAATALTGARFGAFFYNSLDEGGEHYTLHAIAGVPREVFEQFPLPRNTALFGPTFRGDATVRSADVRQDERFGQNPPYFGMPASHLPVVSYLAVPVIARAGRVLGGLFFGHPEPDIFDERAERFAVGLAAQAAVAVENARLYQQAQDELAARGRAEAGKEAFLDAVAHDLGNPLTTVKGQAQLLRRRAQQGRADLATLEAGLGAIEAATDRATRLIAELTDAARLEAQRPLDLRRTAIDLVALAEASQLEAGVGEVVGLWDADRLTRVLENLVANAVKYSPAGSTVVVRINREEAPDGPLAVLSIVDQGVGIPAADLPHIFERFRRGGNVANRVAGSGLGLWGSQRIVAQHGGTIAIDSTEGRGTTVTVRLPLKVNHEIADDIPPAPIETTATRSAD
ncbi:MAG: Sensor protein [Thermomicrobiales bacterium]|nr:Sensor protein [Thermomicrobiales bacterium]